MRGEFELAPQALNVVDGHAHVSRNRARTPRAKETFGG
jgi:hypothetical protein